MIGIERLSHFLTDGFKLANISSDLPYQKSWETKVSNQDFEESQKALFQPFHYLTSGSQSYVFISEDKKYVIKFFKHKRWRINPFYASLPLPASWEKTRAHWMKKKQETVQDTFHSCKISYELFKNDTGVLFIHLNQSNHLQKTLIIKDQIGCTHKLNLDTLQFILQKNAIPTDKYLLTLRKNGQTDVAKKAIQDLLAFTKKRAELGYSDKDPHLIRNFGFIEGKAVEIDVGGFHKDPKKDFNYYCTHEIVKIQDKLLPWIEKNYPEITSFTQKQIEILSK